MRVLSILLILCLANSMVSAQDQDSKVLDQFMKALSFMTEKQEYLKTDSLLKELAPDLKASKTPGNFVYSLFYRAYCHLNEKNYLHALDILFEALDGSESVNDGCDYYLMANIYYGLSDAFYHLGYFELSEYYISYCSDYLNDNSGRYSFTPGFCEARQGYLSTLVGDYYSAIKYFEIAMASNDQPSSLPYRLQWESVMSLCHAQLNNVEIANTSIRKVKSECKNKIPDDNHSLSYVLTREVDIKLLNQDTLGVKSLLDSIHLLAIEDQVKLNYFLNSIKFYELTNQVDSTSHYVDLALDHALTHLSSNKYKLAETYLKSSQIKFNNSDNSQALVYIQEAEKILTEKSRILLDEQSYRSFNARLLIQVLLHKSRIYFSTKNKTDLRATAHSIFSHLDVFLDKRLGSSDSKYFFLKKLKPQFEQLISDCISLEENELAFLIGQKLHGNLLALEMIKNDALTNYELPYGYAELENQLKSGINRREIKLSKLEHGSIAFDSLSKDLLHSRSELKKLTKTIESSVPGYYSLKYSSPQVKSVSDIQTGLLNRKSALVEYFLGEDHLYTFVITHNSFHVIQKLLDNDFLKHVKNQNEHLRGYNDSPKQYKKYVESTEYLHQVLLEDVFDKLNPKVKDLYLVPDDVISYIPFETLFKKSGLEAAQNRYDLLPYLVLDYNFYYHYSSALYESDAFKLPSDLVSYAPSFKNYSHNINLSELKFAKEEVKKISKISAYPAKIDSAASVKSVKESLRQHGIIHLATHAKSNDSLPLLSQLYFEDGPLYVYDIYNSQNKADLVVMSSCETGDGILKEGEGIMSLARSFISSGCETIITSLWNVNDRNSVLIMESFYTYLYKGKSVGHSLVMAKRDFIKESASVLQAHPRNWATFITIGNPNQSIQTYTVHYVLLILLISSLSLIVWKRRGDQIYR